MRFMTMVEMSFLHAGQGGEFVIPQGLVGLEAGGDLR